jgi:trehalose utilization protein
MKSPYSSLKRLTLVFSLSLAPLCLLQAADPKPVQVLVWDEQQPAQKQAYGELFLGETIAKHLTQKGGLTVKTARLDDPQQGLDDATLDSTDVLIFWCHRRVKEQDDARMEAVVKRVLDGKLALIALHSAHWAKPFVRLMQERAKADALAQLPETERASAQWEFTNEQPYYKGVTFNTPPTPALTREGSVWRLALPLCVFPAWRADGAPGHLTALLPQHPIAAGLPPHWDIPQTEMYGEPFHVPAPDEVVFEEKWDKGERFRSGCVWTVGKGRVFYFRPGHETYPVFLQPEPLRVVENAVRWLGGR